MASHNDYASFYTRLTKDPMPPLSVKHFCGSGHMGLQAILFAPAKNPTELFSSAECNNFRSFARQGFAIEGCQELIPGWLLSVSGFILSDFWPIDFSCTSLQQNKIFRVIKKNLVRSSLGLFADAAAKNVDHRLFWKVFCRCFLDREIDSDFMLGEDDSDLDDDGVLLPFAARALCSP